MLLQKGICGYISFQNLLDLSWMSFDIYYGKAKKKSK
jgi:hypothetical protein